MTESDTSFRPFAVAAATLVVSLSMSPVAAGAANHVIVIDRTGSMNTVRSGTGNTRLFDAKDQAVFRLLRGPRLAARDFKNGDRVAVFSFNATDGIIVHQPFVVLGPATRATIVALIRNLPASDWRTNLADAMYVSMDALVTVPGACADFLHLYTDGGENASSLVPGPASVAFPCVGFWSGLWDPACSNPPAPPCTPWQDCLHAQLVPNGIVDVVYFGTTFGGRQSLENGADLGRSRDDPNPDSGWLESLALASGGIFTFRDDGEEAHVHVPTLPAWGLIVLAVLLMTAGGAVFGQRRRFADA